MERALGVILELENDGVKLGFTKMSGAGNDFVVIDNRKAELRDGPSLARKLCDRNWGIGADGLLLIEQSNSADYRMLYYNADGSYGGMCGNGGRCVAAYAFRRGIAGRQHIFEALDHRYRAEISDRETVTLEMKDPKDLQLGFVLPLKGSELKAHFIDTGAPHVVVMTGSGQPMRLDLVDAEGLGREIRYHDRFRPSGTNVNFVEVAGSNRLRIRTYERGVEKETQACGTGSIASAVVASVLGLVKAPVEVQVRSGSILKVEFERKGDFEIQGVRLRGPAVEVFDGVIEL